MGPPSSKKNCYQLWLCKKFVGMPVDQRAEVAAKNKICVRCTSWAHKTTNCKLEWKCRVTLGATACDSIKHHKLFHRSNNAYVNVVHKFNLMKVDKPIMELDLARASSILLQLQVVRFKGAQGLLMFDPGSNVLLITKLFTKSLGLKGINTMHLVQVAGHDP